MPITTQAAFLAEDALAKWLIETLPIKIQIAQVWPFRAIDGKQLKFYRQPAISYDTPPASNGFAEPLADNGTLTDQSSLGDGVGTTFTLGMLATRYRISYNAMDQNRVPNNIDAVEAALAIRRLLYGYFRMIDQSTGAGGTFSTLTDALSGASGQVLNMAGSAPELDDYDDAYFRVKSNNGRPNAIMSNSMQARRFINLCHMSGFQPQYIETEWTDPMRGTVRAPMLSLHGTPWYINDCITPRFPGNMSNIYFMVLGDANDDPGPQHGITGIIPAPLKDTMFVRRETPVMAVPNAPGAGVMVDNVSEINVDYTWPVGIALGAVGSLAIMKDALEAI